jgi:hypothetical protein
MAKPLEQAFDALWAPTQSFSHAMTMHDLSDALAPMCDAVARLGVPESLIPALEGMVNADTHTLDDERSPCALALAAAGRGLAAIVAGVRKQLAKKHGHRITSGQLLAIGTLGKAAPADEQAELVALLESLPRLGDEAKLACAIAFGDLGRPADIAGAVAEMLRDGDDKERLFALGLVERRSDVPAELAAPFVRDHELAVHRAAVRALRARGAAVPELTLYDPMYVAELAASGRDAVHAALADEHGLYRQNLALWIADHPEPSSREPLARAARRMAADDAYESDGPYHYELRWIVRALLAVGDAEDVLDELLRDRRDHVAEPVMRYAEQLSPAVARGMVHVYVNHEHWKQSVA